MQSLFYFIVWAAVFFVMMRFGCGAHIMGHRHRHGDGQPAGTGTDVWRAPPAEDKDPVCGMIVKTATAKSSVHDARAYFFCSADCRDKFEASPGQYIKAAAAGTLPKEHHHGCC